MDSNNMIKPWFSDIPWMYLYCGFAVSLEIAEQYLNYRQLKRYSESKEPNSTIKKLISEDEYIKGNAYNRDKMKFGMFSSVFETVLSLGSTLCYFGPFLWRSTQKLLGTPCEYIHSLAFLGISKLISTFIMIPFELYGDFVVEERHGFNKKTIGLFIKDHIISLGLTAVLGSAITSAIIWIVKWGGPNFYLWLWAFTVATTFGMLIIYPNLIAPLFNKFEPLQDIELKEKIEALAKRVSFPLTKLYQMDGSKRSSHSNAYFYGFWKWKRIVLYDTLLHLPHDEILAIIGHELGHWKMNHMSQMLAISFANTFGMFFLYSRVMDNTGLYKAFGFDDTKAVIIGLTLFGYLLSPYNVILGRLMTLLSRRNEFQADAFAYELGYGEELQNALVAIHKENKSCLDPDPWFSWWHYSHPPLLERLKAINNLKAEASKDD